VSGVHTLACDVKTGVGITSISDSLIINTLACDVKTGVGITSISDSLIMKNISEHQQTF
jgi:hypothetical protein